MVQHRPPHDCRVPGMTTLAEPSMVRRLMLTLTGAFALVWAALFAFFALSALQQETGEIDTHLGQFVAAANAAFDEAGTIDAVRTAARALATVSRRQIAAQQGEAAGEALAARLVVLAGDGTLVYRAADAPRLDYAALPAGFSTRTADGRSWHLAVARSPRWTTATADPADLRRREVLNGLGLELAAYVAAAGAIVLPALLLAVRGGLAPLRRLSAAVAARAPGDLRPLGIPVRHRELKPLAQALDTLLVRQASALERESAFVQDAAHELRTPLAVIGAQAHVLARAADRPAREEALRRLEDALARASRVAGQLLRLAQIEQQGGRSGAAPLDIVPPIADALADLAERAQAQGVELSLSGPDSAMALADPGALRSILDNLLDNAMRHGTGRRVIAVQVQPGPGQVRVKVTDDGAGIPPEEREQVFERFRRGRLATAAGAGLGLTIVREAAAAMGGSVTLTAGPDRRGCRFEVVLPAPPAA